MSDQSFPDERPRREAYSPDPTGTAQYHMALADWQTEAQLDRMVWIVTTRDPAGHVDVEVLDTEPADSLKDELVRLFDDGRIEYAEIRSAYVNGGDSLIEWLHTGRHEIRETMTGRVLWP